MRLSYGRGARCANHERSPAITESDNEL